MCSVKKLGSETRMALIGLSALAAGPWGLGCKRDSAEYPVAVTTEGGVINRIVSDANAGLTLDGSTGMAPRGDAAVEVGGGDGGGGLDAAGDMVAAKVISILVRYPLNGAVVPANEPFKPALDVEVTATPGKLDSLKDVTATLVRTAPARMVLGEVKLTQLGQQTVPETGITTYKVGDTPIAIPNPASGPYEIIIKATTANAAEASETVMFLLDAGPEIRVDSPMEGKYFRGSLPLDLTIRDQYFGPVSSVVATVAGKEVKLAGPGGPSGAQYTATVDFSTFDPRLRGPVGFTVRAQNRNQTEARVTRGFISDEEGPEITNTNPKKGALIGRVITISAEVNDPAGVFDSTVVAVVAHGGATFEVRLNPPPPGAMKKEFTATFDTSRLPINALFPTISFRASDLLGNERVEGYTVALDNNPPQADLDPPDVRALFIPNGETAYRCGWPFDPVGPDAVDDGDTVPQLFDVRARVEDRGNTPLSGSADYVPVALVGMNDAKLLVLDDHTVPLVVNTNPPVAGMPGKGDNACDAINPNIVPSTKPMSSKDALLITMVPFLAGGIFEATPGDDSAAGLCTPGNVLTSAGELCSTTYNQAKARYRFSGGGTEAKGNVTTINMFYTPDKMSSSSVWGLPPYEQRPSLQCGGTQFDALANNISDGWACLAVVAQDKLGNSQVSRPLRVCIDKDGVGNECPHKPIAKVKPTTPIEVETATPHGLATGDSVHIQGVWLQTAANGTWAVQVIDATHFTLTGSTGEVRVGEWPGAYPPGLLPKSLGWVVKWSDAPNCTGTVTAAGPPPTVDAKKPCEPWKVYPKNELWLPPAPP